MHDKSNTESRSVTPPWQASGPAIDYMSDDFARVYEMTGNRVTAPIAMEALRQIGPMQLGLRALDIGAGAGALSVPAAHQGLFVHAVDVAPGMVKLLSERLRPFPFSIAEVMNGENLQIADESFDLAFSIMGISLFNDWRKGLLEMGRVLRPGGKASIATWKTPPGGGPFLVMARALREVFPEKMPPAPSEGFRVLADVQQFADALRSSGFDDVRISEFQTLWQGEGGDSYLQTMRELHRYMAPYAALDERGRDKVDEAVLRIIEEYSVNGVVRIPAVALVAVATKQERH